MLLPRRKFGSDPFTSSILASIGLVVAMLENCLARFLAVPCIVPHCVSTVKVISRGGPVPRGAKALALHVTVCTSVWLSLVILIEGLKRCSKWEIA